MQPYRPRIRTSRLLLQRIKDELLIYDLERNEAHCLNGIAAVVWDLCDGERTVSEIAQVVAPDLPADAAETLVWSALDQFAERHLLEEAETEDPPHSPSLRMTRRQMMVGLGLTVGLALPMVESIVSPPAALAISGSTGGTGMTGG